MPSMLLAFDYAISRYAPICYAAAAAADILILPAAAFRRWRAAAAATCLRHARVTLPLPLALCRYCHFRCATRYADMLPPPSRYCWFAMLCCRYYFAISPRYTPPCCRCFRLFSPLPIAAIDAAARHAMFAITHMIIAMRHYYAMPIRHCHADMFH